MADELKLLGKLETLGADDTVYEIVPVPEWGGSVRVRNLSGGEHGLWEKQVFARDKDGESDYRADLYNAVLMRYGVVDAAGKQLYGDADIPALTAKNSRILKRIGARIAELTGMSGDAAKDTRGKSSAGDTSGTPTGSPEAGAGE
jgi:hypothetical protein